MNNVVSVVNNAPSPTSRRELLAGFSACAIAAGSSPARAAPRPEAAEGLKAAAAKKGILYGCEVPHYRIADDASYRAAVIRDCTILVCGIEMKMLTVLPKPSQQDFAKADAITAFARKNGQRMRGHVLVWHEGLPDWVRPQLRPGNTAQVEDFLRRWIELIAGRYRGQIESWDVVNEIIEMPNASKRLDGLRETPWFKALGPAYIDLAFRILHETDPKAAPAWCEDSLEQDADWMEVRRNQVLRQLEGMRSRGVPIKRFCLQAHLLSVLPLDQKKLRRFLAELAQLGVGIEVTELDIDDRAFPADFAKRDKGVADLGRRFLDVVLDEPAVLNVLNWDIYDPDTWLDDSPERKRPDGMLQRALPLDDQYRRKPLWHAMKKSFEDAPDHSAARERLRMG